MSTRNDRPRAHDRLGIAFIAALHANFVTKGAEAIDKLRQEKPAEYLRLVAAFTPQDLYLDAASITAVKDVSELSDDELRKRLGHLP